MCTILRIHPRHPMRFRRNRMRRPQCRHRRKHRTRHFRGKNHRPSWRLSCSYKPTHPCNQTIPDRHKFHSDSHRTCTILRIHPRHPMRFRRNRMRRPQCRRRRKHRTRHFRGKNHRPSWRLSCSYKPTHPCNPERHSHSFHRHTPQLGHSSKPIHPCSRRHCHPCHLLLLRPCKLLCPKIHSACTTTEIPRPLQKSEHSPHPKSFLMLSIGQTIPGCSQHRASHSEHRLKRTKLRLSHHRSQCRCHQSNCPPGSKQPMAAHHSQQH